MTRVYLKLSIVELETICRNSQADEGALHVVLHELNHRRTKRAMRLMAGVTWRLSQISIASHQLPPPTPQAEALTERVPLVLPQANLRYEMPQHAALPAAAVPASCQPWSRDIISHFDEIGPASPFGQTFARGLATSTTRTKSSAKRMQEDGEKHPGLWVCAVLIGVICSFAFSGYSSARGKTPWRSVAAPTGRPFYGGVRHTLWHGGHYIGGLGSSHRAGTYINPVGGRHYGRHK